MDTTTAAHDRGHIAVLGLSPGRYPTDYVTSVERAGGRPKIFSSFPPPEGEHRRDVEMHTDLEPGDLSAIEGAAGLLMTGGGDIDPARYGQEPHPKTYKILPRRDEFELAILESALERDLPILCICRGMQLLNIYLGGSLEQHIMDVPGRLDHFRDRPRAEVVHGVRLKEGSVLAEIFGTTELGVNSHHHQGLADVPESIEEVAWADDGVLEGVVLRDHTWVVGVQWHPEAMALIDDRELTLFEAFVDATRSAKGVSAA